MRCINIVYYFVFTYAWGWRIIAATCRRVEDCVCHVDLLCGYAGAHEWLQAQCEEWIILDQKSDHGQSWSKGMRECSKLYTSSNLQNKFTYCRFTLSEFDLNCSEPHYAVISKCTLDYAKHDTSHYRSYYKRNGLISYEFSVHCVNGTRRQWQRYRPLVQFLVNTAALKNYRRKLTSKLN